MRYEKRALNERSADSTFAAQTRFFPLSLSLALSSISPFGALACAESQEELDGDEGSFITTSLSLMRKEGNEEKCQS